MTEAAAKTATGTEYVVLEMVEIPSDPIAPHEAFTAWREAGTATSATKAGAIKSVSGEREGVFKAVPQNSWKGALRTAPAVVVKTEELDI